MTTRRRHLQDLARLAIVGALAPLLDARATAANGASLSDEVARAISLLRQANAALQRGRLGLRGWQEHVEDTLATVPLAELTRAIHLDEILRGLRIPPDRAGMTSLQLPGPDGRLVDAALFGLRKGRAIPPHAHNNVVAAHLVLEGELRVRTFQRRGDDAGVLVLEPVRDTVLGRGDVLSVSDDDENAHWLVGISERALTLDVPLQRVRRGREYPTPAQGAGMIFLDPDRGEPDGPRLRVPVIDGLEAIRKYGRRRENLARAPSVPQLERRVAVTVDDLPFVGARSRPVRENLARLAATLQMRGVPACGFVTGSGGDLPALAAWRDAGLALGNHTFSRRALSDVDLAEWMRDVDKNEAAVFEAIGLRMSGNGWFRLPFLDAGDSPTKSRELFAWLRASGKRLAHVSLDTADQPFAHAYADARDRARVATLYGAHVDECAAHSEALARKLYGREVPLVLQLHANELNAERVDVVLDALAARGYRFVALDDVCQDGVYRTYRDRPPLAARDADRNLLRQVARGRGLDVVDKSADAWFRTRWAARLADAGGR